MLELMLSKNFKVGKIYYTFFLPNNCCGITSGFENLL